MTRTRSTPVDENAVPESHTAHAGAPADYEPVIGRLPQALADEAAAALLAEQTAREAQLLEEGQEPEEAHRIAFGLLEPDAA